MLNLSEQRKILSYARELLKARLTHGPEPELDLGCKLLEEKRGIFVTLKLQGRLRGCIGHILGYEPLRKSIHDMTLAAAFEDPRFPPLTLCEWESVKIHISLLSRPAAVKSYQDIRPGTDGIIVTNGWKKGVYLPEVATETGWSKETFLSQLCSQKAGLPGDCWKDPATTIEIFTAEVFSEKEPGKK